MIGNHACIFLDSSAVLTDRNLYCAYIKYGEGVLCMHDPPEVHGEYTNKYNISTNRNVFSLQLMKKLFWLLLGILKHVILSLEHSPELPLNTTQGKYDMQYSYSVSARR